MLPEVKIAKSHTSNGFLYDVDYYVVSLTYRNSSFITITIIIGLVTFLIRKNWDYLLNLYRNIAIYRFFVRVVTQVRMPQFDITLNYSANNTDIVNEIGEFFQKYRFHVTNQDNEMKIRK